MAYHYGANDLIPNLSLGEDVYNQDLPNAVSPLSARTPQDFLGLLTPTADPLTAFARTQVNALLASTASCPGALDSPIKVASQQSALQAAQVVEQDLANQFNLLADTPEMAAIRQLYGFDDMNTGAGRAALAVKSITSGVCRCVSFTAVEGLDTHYNAEWHDDQGNFQAEGFNVIARMIDDLSSTYVPDGSGDTFFDRTNIIAYSEFSRQPMFNGYNGRDHWLSNAFLLAGADIQGGQVIGATSDVGMQPIPINPTTGVIEPYTGESLRPAHIYQALLYAAGFDMNLDPADLRVAPLLPLIKT